jgi:dipeptidyl aminopeptidase/acylaminoacyl peptidase
MGRSNVTVQSGFSRQNGPDFSDLKTMNRLHSTTHHIAIFWAMGIVNLAMPFGCAVGSENPGPPQERRAREAREARVFRARVVPRWFDDHKRFWYTNTLPGDEREFVLVDAEKGTRQLAFDHEKLAAALSSATSSDIDGHHLPFTDIEFTEDLKSVRFENGGKTWSYDLESEECSVAEASVAVAEPEPAEERRSRGRRGGGQRSRGNEPLKSPDGERFAFIKDFNVVVRSGDGDERALSTDGAEGNAYRLLEWSPDGNSIVAWRVEPGDRKEVHLIESSPEGGGRARHTSRPYSLPGDRFAHYDLILFRVDDGSRIRPDVEPLELDWGRPRIHWNQDGRHFSYAKVDRGHQRFRVIRVDSQAGEANHLIDETADTFIWTAHTENVRLERVNWLEKTAEIIYASERDGWRHLYLVDGQNGVIRQITTGAWVVRGIERIDEEERQIWFTASGCHAGQDPYLIHYFRVNFDGTGLVGLTSGNGNHTIRFSPDRRFIIDTYSRVDQAPVTELRRVSDGSLVCKLEEADISMLVESGWEAPEVFVAKGRDGKTDIWGIICRPPDFDPSKKYPVIEQVYAGPQSSYVPKGFSERRRFSNLTNLGFIVVQSDGMGTANRSKAFHDVCWKKLGDAGFSDRILWHKAIAEKYPYYDLARVGIYGTSAGGQNAAGAVLFHPDFYKAAVAASGCHDNRMDKASWNEQWMGYPLGPQYSESSNIDNAHKLGGKLFLIVGELDNNVPPESTMRFVDALVKADKDFDMLVVPGAGHGMGGSYGRRRMLDFFVRHLSPELTEKSAQLTR